MSVPRKHCQFFVILIALLLVCGVAVAQVAPGAQRPTSPPNTGSSKPGANKPPSGGGTNAQPIGPVDKSIGTINAGAATATQETPGGYGATSPPNTPPSYGSNANPTPAPAPGSGTTSPTAPNATAPGPSTNNDAAPVGTMTNPSTMTSPGTSTSVSPNNVMSTQKPAGSTASGSANLLIGNGDLIEVSVYAAPDYDKNVRVDENGNASLPMVGGVKLAGLTISQAEAVIAKRLADGEFFNNPQVTVFIKEYATQGISVLGEVQRPGVYPVLGPRTLFDAISLAGGTSPKAGNLVTITRRANPRDPITVNMSNDGGNVMKSNVDVFPGDTVMVAQAGIVYVVGDVRTPGGYVMDNGQMTLLQALAMAQGANSTAALTRARLVRKGAGGKQEEVPLKLDLIVSGKQSDIPLQADDILFVPNSAAKSAMRRGLESVVQVATGVAIYRR